MGKLIILRGPSGSGKSTVAKQLQLKAKTKTALVEQDYLRRIVLKEHDVVGGVNAGLIGKTAEYALSNGYNVVLEGILSVKSSKEMLLGLISRWQDHYVYYFDIPFEETLRRHATKSNSNEFGEAEMRQWYKPKDTLDIDGEYVIGPELTIDEIVGMVIKDADL